MATEDDPNVVFIEFPKHEEQAGDPVAELEETWAPLDAIVKAHLERRGDELGLHRLARIDKQEPLQD